MANPTVSAVLNKTAYRPGEEMILTVSYSDPDQKVIAVTVQVTDSLGNQSAPVTVNAVVDQLTIAVTDSSGRVWTKVPGSDTGSMATYKALA